MNWDERRPLNVASTDRKKTQVERIHDLLKDGQPHYHHELYALGCIAHSRVAELRTRLRPQGQDIACWADKGPSGERVSVYQLVSLSKPEANRLGPDASGSENERISPQETGTAVEPPAVVPDIAEAGGSLPCSPADAPDGRPAGRHPSSAKQLEIWSAA